MSLLSHIDAAIDELREAERNAGLGTRLMLQEERESLEQLRSRVENIDDNEDQTESG